jgi:hypothetical protein
MIQCSKCGADASERGSLVELPDGDRAIYCGKCKNPLNDDSGASFEFYWGYEEEAERGSDRWWAVIRVMSKLRVWKPYLVFVQYVLDRLTGV